MSKPIVTIENWAVVRNGTYVAYEELQPGNILTGKVYGHDRLPDAKPIYTSPIVRIDSRRCLVETRNTVYRLGEVNQDYRNSEEYQSWDCERRSSFAA